MVKVKFYGLLRLTYKVSIVEEEAKDVNELIEILAKKIEGLTVNELRDSLIFVQGTNIMKLKKYHTKLNDGDEVLFMSPVAGG
jgi:molybdopterin converting factor small subunit